jgi:hypothetical protein
MDEFDEPNDHQVFDITDVSVNYSRSKDQKRVSILVKDSAAISEMKLYLILTMECHKLELRLGIHSAIEDLNH